MKISRIFLAVAALAAFAVPAFADQPHTVGNIFNAFGPQAAKAAIPATTAPSAASQTQTKSVLTALLGVQAQVVADVTEANVLASTPLSQVQAAAACSSQAGAYNSTTNVCTVVNVSAEACGALGGAWTGTAPALGSCAIVEVWDPIAEACYPTLISFINGLPGPSALPTPPTGKGGLVTAAEEARLVAIAASEAINNISLTGYPNSLKLACDPLVLETGAAAGAALVSINALLLKFIPGAAVSAIALPKL